MMGRTHAAIGTATALGICAIDPPALLPGFAFVVAATASSKLPDRLEFNGLLPHRGPTHWLFSGILVTFVLGLLAGMLVWTRPVAGEITAGVLIGYLMHLVADACTVSGVPLLGPFSRRDRRLLPLGLRAVTGGPKDTITGLLATAASVALLSVLLLPLPQDGILVSDHCERTTARVYLSKRKYPNITAHIKESWRKGYPHVLTIHRKHADERRERLLRGISTRPGYDRDEAPAATLRSSWRADVAYVPSSENRSAGARLGAAIDGHCNGSKVVYVFGP